MTSSFKTLRTDSCLIFLTFCFRLLTLKGRYDIITIILHITLTEDIMYPNYEQDKILVKCVPSERQIALEKMEFYAFACITVNTFTDLEWGSGTEPESVFDPSELDAGQWVEAVKSAGMTGIILTCKHHDGFCIWQSDLTEHCVKNSPFRGGKGDVVREVSDACRRGGIKFGVYLSPWDRNCPLYGQGKAYDDYFCGQLTELLTRYGDVFTVWFDGACGEGPNGKRQVYDWERYYSLIRKLQPDAVISICGPDVRWCGNEAGDTRESEWSVLPTGFDSPDAVGEKSQKSDDASFREKKISETERDLGSREFLKGASGYAWRPSETDTSIRPGWFYHASEDDKVRSTETLIDIWYRTVGGNSTLLLNIPPDRRGLMHETDVSRLAEIGEYLRKEFAVNLAADASVSSDRCSAGHGAECVRDDSYDTYFSTDEGENTACITFRFDEEKTVRDIVIKENITMSQRIEKFSVDIEENGSFRCIYNGMTVGYKKIVRLDSVKTSAVRIRITDSRVCPVISFIGIY